MDGHDHGMMMTPSPPPPPSSMVDNMTMPDHNMMNMMQMTFYWGKNTQVLFSGWPGTSTGMYVLSLFFVLTLAFLLESLSRTRIVKPGNDTVFSALLRTLLHALRIGLAYLVMLALMSFNVGIFLFATLGHAVGFLVFSTRLFGLGKDGLDDPHFPH